MQSRRSTAAGGRPRPARRPRRPGPGWSRRPGGEGPRRPARARPGRLARWWWVPRAASPTRSGGASRAAPRPGRGPPRAAGGDRRRGRRRGPGSRRGGRPDATQGEMDERRKSGHFCYGLARGERLGEQSMSRIRRADRRAPPGDPATAGPVPARCRGQSGQEFKASVLGAYERGERALSVGRLVRLAELYDVPADQLLPRTDDLEIDLTRFAGETRTGSRSIWCACNNLEQPDAEVLGRYAATIQLQRQDFNGRMLTIRRDDVRVLAAVLGRRPRTWAPTSTRSGCASPPDPRPRRSFRLSVAVARRALATSHYAPRDVSAPSSTQLKVLVPGNHLMVGPARPTRRVAEDRRGRVPGHDPRARQRDHGHGRARRRGARRPPVRGARRCWSSGATRSTARVSAARSR